MDDIKLVSASEVILKFKKSVEERNPFSLIRFGDGGLKVIKAYLNRKKLLATSRKEGIPHDFFGELVRQWVIMANDADYIDSCDFYFKDAFHKKRAHTSRGTKRMMYDWKALFKKVGININREFCSPEMGLLFF